MQDGFERITRVVDGVIGSRRSIRAFLPKPVPTQTIKDILAVASRAPSGSNSQPWQVYVLTDSAREGLVQRLLEVYDDPQRDQRYVPEYPYYPQRWISPFQERRRQVGWDLYSTLGIARGEKRRMHAQFARNFRFFDAPVGLIFTRHRVLEQGSLIDYGTFLQNVMLAARARGLDTCPQAAFNWFYEVISDYLAFDPDEMLVCGMSLGFRDPDAIENDLHTPRESPDVFARFIDQLDSPAEPVAMFTSSEQ